MPSDVAPFIPLSAADLAATEIVLARSCWHPFSGTKASPCCSAHAVSAKATRRWASRVR